MSQWANKHTSTLPWASANRSMVLRAFHLPAILGPNTILRHLRSSCSALPFKQTVYRTYADAASRNANIPHRTAMLVERETGKLKGPLSLEEILDGRAKGGSEGRHYVEAVELVAEKPQPIVKYVNIREEYMKSKVLSQKKREVAKAQKTKEIQVNFQVADGDLAHKLKKAREALEQGHRVIIVYTNKKRIARFTPSEMQEKAVSTVEMLADVAREFKPLDVLHSSATISLEPKSK
ncbi:hypothetical protein BDW22DRAFT_1425048 [Trametopsis cervina]|nr:hypothetical protein BDW22DRAFT_1425048 [Trametopsis cervina]